MSGITFIKAPKKREELQLPILHFVAADDWIDKLGMDAFRAWLKFYTWCDRSDERKDPNNDVIPNSLNKIMKKLGVGKKKFYNAIIRPLWNYGFIDLIEYEESENIGTKPVNIVVYEYPQNDVSKKYEPLEKIRDYDEDYQTNTRIFIKKGIEAKAKKENERSGCFTGKQGGVSQGNKGVFPTETRGSFTGNINNDSNNINNDSNHHQENDEIPYLNEYIEEYSLSPEEKEMMMTRIYERREEIQSKDKKARYRYYNSVLQTIRESVRMKTRENYQPMKPKEDKLPKWLQQDLAKRQHNDDGKKNNGLDEELDDKEFEEEKRKLEELLEMRKRKHEQEE